MQFGNIFHIIIVIMIIIMIIIFNYLIISLSQKEAFGK